MCLSVSLDVHSDLHRKVNTAQNELIRRRRRLEEVRRSLEEARWDREGAR